MAEPQNIKQDANKLFEPLEQADVDKHKFLIFSGEKLKKARKRADFYSSILMVIGVCVTFAGIFSFGGSIILLSKWLHTWPSFFDGTPISIPVIVAHLTLEFFASIMLMITGVLATMSFCLKDCLTMRFTFSICYIISLVITALVLILLGLNASIFLPWSIATGSLYALTQWQQILMGIAMSVTIVLVCACCCCPCAGIYTHSLRREKYALRMFKQKHSATSVVDNQL